MVDDTSLVIGGRRSRPAPRPWYMTTCGYACTCEASLVTTKIKADPDLIRVQPGRSVATEYLKDRGWDAPMKEDLQLIYPSAASGCCVSDSHEACSDYRNEGRQDVNCYFALEKNFSLKTKVPVVAWDQELSEIRIDSNGNIFPVDERTFQKSRALVLDSVAFVEPNFYPAQWAAVEAGKRGGISTRSLDPGEDAVHSGVRKPPKGVASTTPSAAELRAYDTRMQRWWGKYGVVWKTVPCGETLVWTYRVRIYPSTQSDLTDVVRLLKGGKGKGKGFYIVGVLEEAANHAQAAIDKAVGVIAYEVEYTMECAACPARTLERRRGAGNYKGGAPAPSGARQYPANSQAHIMENSYGAE